MTTASAIDPAIRRSLHRAVRILIAATIAWNAVEAIVAISAGVAAGSTALLGFGLDSVVEVLSAAAVAWQFGRRDPERWERPTLRAIAIAFFALALWVSVSAVASLLGARDPEASPVGVGLAIASLAVMPALALAKHRVGRRLGSTAVVADARQTLVCALLSVALLVGLVLDALAGWWWADAVIALVIAAFAVREGVEAWQGDTCATPIGELAEERAAELTGERAGQRAAERGGLGDGSEDAR